MRKEPEKTVNPSASDNMYFTCLSTRNIKYNKNYSSSLQWVFHYKAQVSWLFFQHTQAGSIPQGNILVTGSPGNF